ncbi:uncharacterized protein LOC131957326 [Physella acuta]|uniref:uncharacterized protein LOC131957326 n=1 Tax=Physella acuta TaxID=109671 RepID=UPI0027DC0B6D|nr:uncharacterized protein LOC131957326 [Physella acuta]
MAGRPKAALSIVPANEVMPLCNIRTEVWRLQTLCQHLQTPDSALQWCARRRLVQNSVLCVHCNQPCSLNRYQQGSDGRRWSCDGCNYRRSVREHSFFARSHLSIQKIVIIIYCWAHDMPQKQILHEADVAENSVVDWCKFMREECSNWMQRNGTQVGGLDDHGEPIVVEIDESKYFHRKYHRGQWREGHWVFGGIERDSGRCFLTVVQDRSAATLQACILQHILPGTHIISDGWAAYANISQLGQGIFEHSVVVHEEHFVDPEDSEIHTQNIENM